MNNQSYSALWGGGSLFKLSQLHYNTQDWLAVCHSHMNLVKK